MMSSLITQVADLTIIPLTYPHPPIIIWALFLVWEGGGRYTTTGIYVHPPTILPLFTLKYSDYVLPFQKTSHATLIITMSSL